MIVGCCSRGRRSPPPAPQGVRDACRGGPALTPAPAPRRRLRPRRGLRAPPTSFATDRAPCAICVHRRSTSSRPSAIQTQARTSAPRIFVATGSRGGRQHRLPGHLPRRFIVADFGNTAADHDNVSKVRKLVFAGRIAPRGEFVNALRRNSAVGAVRGPAAGNFRDFLRGCRLAGPSPEPPGPTRSRRRQRGSGSEVSRPHITLSTRPAWRTVSVAAAYGWREPDLPGRPGAARNAGQPFELSGAGRAAGSLHRRRRPLPGR